MSDTNGIPHNPLSDRAYFERRMADERVLTDQQVKSLSETLSDKIDSVITLTRAQFEGHRLAHEEQHAAYLREQRTLSDSSERAVTALASSVRETQQVLAQGVERERQLNEKVNEASWRAHSHEHLLVQLAVDKEAEANANYRTSQNEWRGTLAENNSSFVRKEAFSLLEQRISKLENLQAAEAGKASGFALVWGGAVAFLSIGVAVALHFIR